MPWPSLAETLELKPLVLAGPILRKVTPLSVTVWLALKNACTVTLTVYSSAGRALLTGTRASTEIGTHLHLVAVTADHLVGPTTALAEGQVFSYDLSFTEAGSGTSYSLAAASQNASLSYPGRLLPSLCLPPSDVNKLRIVHGSCRKPHGDGPDALALLDDLLATTHDDPFARPQQLLLTGDQIYADDVAAGLLTMITDAARTLLAWGGRDELMPLPDSPLKGVPEPRKYPPVPGHRLPPYQRNYALGLSGFTSDDMGCHLMSLGEYLCMYLFAWSDVLWRRHNDGSAELPPPEDIVETSIALRSFAPQDADARREPAEPWRNLSTSAEKRADKVRTIARHNEGLVRFHGRLGRVRRALANVPVYMIFDDHEITDDWNMRLASTLNIHESALGRRVVQNGMVAYALCQHWGNAPEQFADDGTLPPGRKLLSYLDKARGDDYAQRSALICAALGLPTAAEIRSQRRLIHGPDSLRYHHLVRGPGHKIVFTDSRTWRSYSPRGETILIPEDVLRQQFADGAVDARQALLVVLSTNAPPVRSIRTAEGHDTLVNRSEHHPDLYESWALPSDATDRLFKVISDQLPLVDGTRQGSALLISGDVHHGFASRLLFEGHSRFEDSQDRPQPVSAVYGQLVSSAFCNANGATRGLHREGHDYTPSVLQGMAIPKGRTERLCGRNLRPGEYVRAGTTTMTSVLPELHQVQVFQNRSGTVGGMWEFNFRPNPGWDWAYRLDYLHPTASPLEAITPPAARAGDTAATRRDSGRDHHRFAAAYRQYNRTGGSFQEVVGVNCISEVRFEWPSQGARSALHTMFWEQPGDQDPKRYTTVRVSLDPARPALLDPDLTLERVGS